MHFFITELTLMALRIGRLTDRSINQSINQSSLCPFTSYYLGVNSWCVDSTLRFPLPKTATSPTPTAFDWPIDSIRRSIHVSVIDTNRCYIPLSDVPALDQFFDRVRLKEGVKKRFGSRFLPEYRSEYGRNVNLDSIQ